MSIDKLNEERKMRIFNSALKEFVLKGFDSASTNIIAKNAGISKALMFHYVGNKKELFFIIYDYFETLLEEDYYANIDFEEKDLLRRLRQAYDLQLELIKKHPSILDFDKLVATSKDDEINSKILQNKSKESISECTRLFSNVDESLYRKGIDVEKCKQFILWSNVGFTNQIMTEIKDSNQSLINYEKIRISLDSYFEELRNIFYEKDNEGNDDEKSSSN